MQRFPHLLQVLVLLLLAGVSALVPRFMSSADSRKQHAATFRKTVRPFLNDNCVFCHNKTLKTAGLQLDSFRTPRAALKGDAKKIADIAKINRYHMEQFAYFIGKLRSTPDGDGSLLDHSMVVYGSGLADGNPTPTMIYRCWWRAADAGLSSRDATSASPKRRR